MRTQKLKCGDCPGHINAATAPGGYGVNTCQICWKTLCRKHTIMVDGRMYCGECKPGYRGGKLF